MLSTRVFFLEIFSEDERSRAIKRKKRLQCKLQAIPDVAWEARFITRSAGILSKAVKGWGSAVRRLFRIFRVLRHSSRARMTASFDDERYRHRRFMGWDVNRGIRGSTLPSRRKLTVGERDWSSSLLSKVEWNYHETSVRCQWLQVRRHLFQS